MKRVRETIQGLLDPLEIPMSADDHLCSDCQSLMTQPWRINVGKGLEVVCSGCGDRKITSAARVSESAMAEMMRASGLFQVGSSGWSNDPATVYAPSIGDNPQAAQEVHALDATGATDHVAH
jgi:hypothetical protein